MDPGTLYAVADAALKAIGAHYQAEAVNLPDHRLVTPGLPAWDCEAVAVHAETLTPIDGDPVLGTLSSREDHPAFHMRAVTLGITVARVAPLSDDGSASPVAAEQQVAKLVYQDPILCWNALVAAAEDGTLPCCGGIGFVSWQSLGPEGGIVGGVLRVAVSLE